MPKYNSAPNYIHPFDGWVVTYEDDVHPSYFKKFTGSRAQLDAQTLACLLNLGEEKK